MMRILDMTISQMNNALRIGLISKKDILATAVKYDVTDAVLMWLDERITE